MGKVTMHHPQSGVTQQASADAFARVWQGEGWQIVDQPEQPAAKGKGRGKGKSEHPAEQVDGPAPSSGEPDDPGAKQPQREGDAA